MSLFWLLLACGPKQVPAQLQAHHDLPPFRAEVGAHFDEWVAMPDGTRLHTRVWLPEGEGPFPTLFTRVPYPMDARLDGLCATWTRYGYACAWQKVRGQGKSEGSWTPMLHERTDGQAALSWLVAQPWNDGNVALFGESYLAATQWFVADVLPEQVKTFVPQIFAPDTYATAFRGGLFRHDVTTAWMSLAPGRGLRIFGGSRYQKALRTRPRSQMDVASAGMTLPWFRDWMQAERGAPFWQSPLSRTVASMPERVAVPVFSIAGWSDTFLGPQLDAWQALATKDQSTLVVGPWDHLGRVASDVPLEGVRDPRIGATSGYSLLGRKLDWFDQHLTGAKPTFEGGVWTYVTGGGRWEHHASWPPVTAGEDWHFAGGDAQHCMAVLTRGRTQGEVSWTYDPTDPTPTVGGAGLLGGALPLFGKTPPGLRDQGELCSERADLVGFRSAPFEQPTVLAGPLTATLAVSADTTDSAIGVRFLERRSDGTLLHLREDLLALSFREDDAHKVPYTPGEVVEVQLMTWPLHHELAAGSSLVVQLASASFPKYEAHANTSEPWDEAERPVPATLTVDFARSWVTLPVVQ